MKEVAAAMAVEAAAVRAGAAEAMETAAADKVEAVAEGRRVMVERASSTTSGASLGPSYCGADGGDGDGDGGDWWWEGFVRRRR